MGSLQSDQSPLELGDTKNLPEGDQGSEQWVEISSDDEAETLEQVATESPVATSDDDDLGLASLAVDAEEPAIDFTRLLFDLRNHSRSSLSCEGKTCRMVFGYTGAGKTTLLNYIFGRDQQQRCQRGQARGLLRHGEHGQPYSVYGVGG